MKKILISVVLLIYSFCSGDQSSQVTISPDDFDYVMPIEVDEAEKLYGFSMPNEVYMHVRYGDLRDVAMFNSKLELVPVEIRKKAPKKVVSEIYETVAYYRTQDKKDSKDDKKVTPAYLVVDLSSFDTVPVAVIFTFEKNRAFSSDFTLSFSYGNLDSWSWYKTAGLAQLKSSGGDMLISNVIEMPSISSDIKYMRIAVADPEVAGYIENIQLKFVKESYYSEFLQVDKKCGVESFSGGYMLVCDQGGFFPVSKISFNIPKSYFLPSYNVYTKKFTDDEWGYIYKSDTFAGEDSTISGRQNRVPFWGITVGGMPSGEIVGTFYWQPDDIIFVARGEGPYLLAYGKDGFSRDVVQINTDNISHGVSILGERYIGGGDLIVVPEKVEKNYAKILMYTVAGLIAVILTFLAIRLIKEVD